MVTPPKLRSRIGSKQRLKFLSFYAHEEMANFEIMGRSRKFLAERHKVEQDVRKYLSTQYDKEVFVAVAVQPLMAATANHARARKLSTA
jgi:hypothetical protein